MPTDTNTATALSLPPARGPLSAWVLECLRGRGGRPPGDGADAFGDDAQLALYLAYESHYSELPGASADVEWDPDLIALRRRLEQRYDAALRDAIGSLPTAGDVRELIPAMIAHDSGPSLSRHLEGDGSLAELRQLVVERSAYQLKEADGHTFGIPRLRGAAKQLLVLIQAGEYGVGEYGADEPGRLTHAALYAQTMRALGLDDRPHAYLAELPASALAVSNVISMFGLDRRRRGALAGHLAVVEMTSVVPMGRYSRALDRLGAPEEARRFYDVHVLADAEHEVLALDLAAAVVAAEPHLLADVVFGAAAALETERRFATALLRRWRT